MDEKFFFLELRKLIDQYLGDIECKYTVHSWLDFWYREFKVGKVKPSSLSAIDSVIRLHLKPNVPDVSLSALSVLELQDGLMKISSSRMREYSKVTISEALKKAKELRYVSENVAESVIIPKHHAKEGVALTVEQERVFFEKARKSFYYGAYLFMRWTGCRPGEAFTVRWKDVDLINDTVWISGTKTEGSARLVPLFPPLKEYLSRRCGMGFDKVFPGTINGAKHVIMNIEVPFHVSCKDFRTTFATRCGEAGVSDKVLQKWLGHTSAKTTQKYYIKVLPDYERSEVMKLATLISCKKV